MSHLVPIYALLFILHSLISSILLLSFFLHVCKFVCAIGRFQLGSSLWPLFPPSLPLFLSLPGRLERNWSLGGSREEPGKEGTKCRPSAAITTLHFLSSLSLSFSPCSSLPRLPSLPSPHWPAPQIKTSDKKMGSIKKGEKATEREKEGSP